MKPLIIIILTTIFVNFSFGQQFSEIPISEDTEGLYFSEQDFGDIDNDGDIDIVIIGNLDPGVTSKIYLNEGNTFVETTSQLPFLNSGSIELFDADNDGDLDVIVSGDSDNFTARTLIMFNDGTGNFTDSQNQEVVNVKFSSSSISDVDLDGDLDILLNGFDDISARTDLYFNDGSGNFTLDTGNSFIAADDGDASFVDVDNDGDDDLFVLGWDENSIARSFLYINDGSGNFTQSSSQFIGVVRSSVLPIDVDGDNDMDVVISGIVDPSLHQTKLYINDGSGNYSESAIASFTNIGNGDLSASDIDLDGDIDILLSGNIANTFMSLTQLYINNGDGSFTINDTENFDGFILGHSEFVDFDQDGDDDLFLTGLSNDLLPIHKLYENNQTISSIHDSEKNNQIEMSIYPNIIGAGSEFNIEMNSSISQDVDINIFDCHGKVLNSFSLQLQANNQDKKVLQSPKHPGVYFIQSSIGNLSKKLIVTH